MMSMPDLKRGARTTWAKGDYRQIAQFLPPAAAHVVRLADVRPGEKVLDVACGTGIAAITAARAGAVVTGIDITPELLDEAKASAAIAGATGITWREADAEALPFGDATFDVVVSTFGHMFTPDPRAVAREMLRVAKPGARIAFTTWPPESAVGMMFKAIGALVPPPAGAAPPPQWGVRENVLERLGSGVWDVSFEEGQVTWPFLSPAHLWDLFSTTYGPFVVALDKLAAEPAKQAKLASDVQAIFGRFFRDNQITFDYLATRAIKS